MHRRLLLVSELEDVLERLGDLASPRMLSDDGRQRDIRKLHPHLHQGPKPVIELLMIGPAEARQDIASVQLLQIPACRGADAIDKAGLNARKRPAPFLILPVLGPSRCHTCSL